MAISAIVALRGSKPDCRRVIAVGIESAANQFSSSAPIGSKDILQLPGFIIFITHQEG